MAAPRALHAPRRPVFAPAALIALVVGLPVAVAQDALGDGRALDGSLSTQSRYNPTRVDPGAEFRFRNAVATGNAPGGLSLRADVGYTSPFEFRGELGEDDLFSFRRDSLYSGLAGMGIRGTDALQYQFALTTGSHLPQNLVGSDIVTRGGARTGGSSVASQGYSTAAPLRQPTEEERTESQRLTGMLRSPSSYATTRSMRPVFLGNVANLSGQVEEQAVSASSLRGVRIVDLAKPPAPTGSPEAQSQRVRTAYDVIIESQLQRTRVNTSAETGASQSPGEGETGTGGPEGMTPEDWRSRLDALRDQMLNGDRPQGTPPSGQTPANANDPNAQPADPDAPVADPGNPGATPGGNAGVPSAPKPRFDPETIRNLRPSGAPIKTLVDPDSPLDSIYAGHMESGQKLLEVGRYFDAEERFTRALSMRAGDVAAQVGRLHAQLGAGLFISAGLNLRELVLTSPEVAATRFAPELLPGAARTEELIVLLSERAGLVEDRPTNDAALKRECGLLLAYLAYQRGDRALVERGLAAASSTLGVQEVEKREMDERLISYLTELWAPASEPDGE